MLTEDDLLVIEAGETTTPFPLISSVNVGQYLELNPFAFFRNSGGQNNAYDNDMPPSGPPVPVSIEPRVKRVGHIGFSSFGYLIDPTLMGHYNQAYYPGMGSDVYDSSVNIGVGVRFFRKIRYTYFSNQTQSRSGTLERIVDFNTSVAGKFNSYAEETGEGASALSDSGIFWDAWINNHRADYPLASNAERMSDHIAFILAHTTLSDTAQSFSATVIRSNGNGQAVTTHTLTNSVTLSEEDTVSDLIDRAHWLAENATDAQWASINANTAVMAASGIFHPNSGFANSAFSGGWTEVFPRFSRESLLLRPNLPDTVLSINERFVWVVRYCNTISSDLGVFSGQWTAHNMHHIYTGGPPIKAVILTAGDGNRAYLPEQGTVSNGTLVTTEEFFDPVVDGLFDKWGSPSVEEDAGWDSVLWTSDKIPTPNFLRNLGTARVGDYIIGEEIQTWVKPTALKIRIRSVDRRAGWICVLRARRIVSGTNGPVTDEDRTFTTEEGGLSDITWFIPPYPHNWQNGGMFNRWLGVFPVIQSLIDPDGVVVIQDTARQNSIEIQCKYRYCTAPSVPNSELRGPTGIWYKRKKITVVEEWTHTPTALPASTISPLLESTSETRVSYRRSVDFRRNPIDTNDPSIRLLNGVPVLEADSLLILAFPRLSNWTTPAPEDITSTENTIVTTQTSVVNPNNNNITKVLMGIADYYPIGWTGCREDIYNEPVTLLSFEFPQNHFPLASLKMDNMPADSTDLFSDTMTRRQNAATPLIPGGGDRPFQYRTPDRIVVADNRDEVLVITAGWADWTPSA